MISSVAYKKVKIHITTYQNEDSKKKSHKKMDKEKYRLNESNRRLICSVCLNSNNSHNCNVDGGRIPKPCPLCRKTSDSKNETKQDHNTKHDRKDAIFYTYDHKTYNSNNQQNASIITPNDVKGEKHSKSKPKECIIKADNSKIVQTSQTDLTQDLSLLKEVLTVFQSKKQLEIKSNNSKTVMKDVSVATESQSKIVMKPKLTKSKMFQFSIEELCCNDCNTNNFKVVNSSQPNNNKSSYSIDLIKHKSSSIPQMKLEELKYSLKEKTKSKDAIEEVNRMFATVRRSEKAKTIEDHNRPMVRNGPRVLPVVKTNTYQDTNKCNSDSEVENKELDESCKCCQTNNLQMSAGDSFFKHECCYHKMLHEGKCEKCVYMLCCHYQNNGKIETGSLVCEHCRKSSVERHEVSGESNCGHF